MSTKMPAPAYQEYAANMLADHKFRRLSMMERGLFWTIRLECWVNKSVPSDVNELAEYLFQDADIIDSCLPKIMHFLEITDEKSLICPFLENYRLELEERRRKQSAGGKKGAKITNSKRTPETITAKNENRQSGDSQVTRESLGKNKLDRYSPEQINQNSNQWECDISLDDPPF